MRTTSEKARRAIVEAALVTFGKRGYGLATLEEIGALVGISRGAVLYHFKSKAGLLAVVVDPCRQALAQLLSTPPNDSPTVDQRRQLLTEFADLLIAHRRALRLLANDISARIELELGVHWFVPPELLVNLLVGIRASHVNQVQVAAAIGAMMQPVTWATVDLDNARTRTEMIEAAVAVFQRLRVTASSPELAMAVASPTIGAVPVARVAAP